MRFVDWVFRDRTTGRIVVGQWPNLPLWFFLGAQTIAWLASADERIAEWARVVSYLALAIWAADELIRGVNPWRRCLGGSVLIWMAIRVLA